VDGLIQDPRICPFDPGVLKCAASDPAPDSDPLCLSGAQVNAVRAIYQGPVTSKGVQLYPGYTRSDPGGDFDDPNDIDGWGLWITGFNTPTIPPPANGEPWGAESTGDPATFENPPLQWTFQDQYLKFFVFNSASFNAFTFDLNNAAQVNALVTESSTGGADALIANLTKYRDMGGKLILYHGWSDPALTPLQTVRYYKRVIEKTSGGDISATRKFARLFMVPGMHHCTGGPGPNIFDLLTALDTWKTAHQAPDSILAIHFFDNVLPPNPTAFPDRTMPLCAFPERAHFTGGDKFEASNWECF
jgi:feruloyl esterase